MKKLFTLILACVLSLSSTQMKAQAFDRNTQILSLGIGGSDMFHIR
jgi:hypothetical protein